MVFYPPQSAARLKQTIPDSISLPEFLFEEEWGRAPFAQSKDPFVCGLTGKGYSASEQKRRTELLARSIARETGWAPGKGSEWDKIVGVFTLNSVDFGTVCWAAHQLDCIVSPGNASYSVPELTHQLKSSSTKILFTCEALLAVALEAASNVGIPKGRIFVLELPALPQSSASKGFKTVQELIDAGASLPPISKTKWTPGRGKSQVAFLCYSSGTSGLPKGVMISHYNVISNILQYEAHEWPARDSNKGSSPIYTGNNLGLLPFSHIYGLVLIVHASVYRGDRVVVLPKFELESFLHATATHKINCLYIVPPIIVAMLRQKELCAKYDLSSVKGVYTGAAPLGIETAEELQAAYPKIDVLQGYGMTESATVISFTTFDDIWLGSCGTLCPEVEAKLVTADGREVTGYGQTGELLLRAPSVTLGYLNNEKATAETFVNGWLHTGDEAMFQKSPKGNAHLFITDRIKELIKTKGHQVAPAELEDHILSSPLVDDCAVIPIPDLAAGEVPKAYVVKSRLTTGESDDVVKERIIKHVQDHKARYKWLKGGVEFIDVIPKSPSGKILRRLLKDKEKARRMAAGAKL